MSLLDQAADVLSAIYIPTKLIGRDKQLGVLTQSTPRPSNYFIEGCTNVGKTATARQAIEVLNQRPHHKCVYVKCERSFMLPFRAAVEKAVGHITFRQHPIDELFTRAEKNEMKFVHIFLDDAHMLARYEEQAETWTEVVHKLYEGAKGLVTLQMVVVGTLPYISYLRFTSALHIDSKWCGQFVALPFGNYTPNEMTKIYSERLKLLPMKFDEGAVSWVVSTVSSNAGELPMGFNLLFHGVEEMISEKSDMLRMKHVEAAFPKVKTDYWRDQLGEMDAHSKLLLEAATNLVLNDNWMDDPNKASHVTGHAVAVEYEKLCQQRKIKPLYTQRRNYLLKKLSIEGFFRKEEIDTGTFSVKYRYELNPMTLSTALLETSK